MFNWLYWITKKCNNYLLFSLVSASRLLVGSSAKPDAHSSGFLSVTDERTGRKYTIPIQNNAVKALDFIQITTAGFGADKIL